MSSPGRIQHRRATILGCATLLAALACSAGNAPARTPAEDDGAIEPSSRVGASSGQEQSLPRYFTLELVGSEARLQGRPLRGRELSERIDQEASDGQNAGVVIRLHDGFSGEALGAIVWELSVAGFEHIIVSKRDRAPLVALPPEQETTSAGEPSPEPSEQPVPPEPPSSALPPTAAQSPAPAVDVPPSASLRTIGLHVGGGPNDDATRKKFIAPIEKHFDDLLRCHALAENAGRNASVGVDLLIAAKGGRPSLEDLRTALSGEGFEACIRKVFGQVTFPPITRPTVVSYSMLYEPVAEDR